MKRLAILFLLFATLGAFAQTSSSKISMTKAQWPIKDANVGDNIIGKPGMPINGEPNYSDLFISADEGRTVVAPVDGVIRAFNYTYSSSLTTLEFGSRVTNVDGAYDLDLRKNFAKRLQKKAGGSDVDPAQYVSVSIGIATSNGETYYISGLRPVKLFKTGDKVKPGDVVGSVGYAYSSFKIPHIRIARSINGKAADPMGVFGIPSTFKESKARKYDVVGYKNPVDSLKKDFAIFRKSLEEVHPGLYDYTSKAVMDSLFTVAEGKLTEPATTREFSRVLNPILRAIKDSHTYMSYIEGIRLQKFPSAILGYDGKTVFVASATPTSGCKKGEEVVAIDGVDVSKFIQNTKGNMTSFDGYNEQPIDRDVMERLTFHAGAYSYLQGRSLKLKMKGGREVTPPLVPVSKVPFVKFNNWAPNQPSYATKMLNLTTAYLDINTFELNQVEEDSIENFVSRIQQQGTKNLIIDVRDNRGGSIEVGNRMISYFIDSPKKVFCYKMVKSNTTYPILSNSNNYTSDQVIYPKFKAVDGKSGFYYYGDGDSSIVKVLDPNAKTRFKGSIYILTNEYSASMASDFPSTLYGQSNCRIIGRETGSSYYQMNAENFAEIMMTATGLKMRIPMVKCVFHDTPNPKIPWGHGVIPDYNVPLTYDELAKPKDVIFDRAMEIIEGKKK